METLATLVEKIANPSYYVVDIGASTGVTSDPSYKYITNPKYRGLCIEGKEQCIRILSKKTHCSIHCGYITPANALEIFRQYNVPVDIDIMKIDIDGYDLEVLRVLLTEYKPKIIVTEINEKIPPPILFEVLYKDNYEWDYSHCFGFSIASGAQVLTQFKYKILALYELNNIVCINDELCVALSIPNNNKLEYIMELYKRQYIDEEKTRLDSLPWNNAVNYWLKIKDPKTLKLVITLYFTTNNDRSKFVNKKKIEGVDFSIGVAEE